MAKNKLTLTDKIENNPMKAMYAFFGSGFGICFIFMQFYYSDRINDIKQQELEEEQLEKEREKQEKKAFDIVLSHKILEVQQQEREKYYQKIDENSTNGKLLEIILDYKDKKGGSNEK